jgi:hypothetical protein
MAEALRLSEVCFLKDAQRLYLQSTHARENIYKQMVIYKPTTRKLKTSYTCPLKLARMWGSQSKYILRVSVCSLVRIGTLPPPFPQASVPPPGTKGGGDTLT